MARISRVVFMQDYDFLCRHRILCKAARNYVEELLLGPMWKSHIKHNHPSDDYEYAADNRFYGRADLLEVRSVELGKPTRVEEAQRDN